MSNNNSEMSLLEHLSELRKRLTVVVVANVAMALIFFQLAGRIMKYLLNINPGMELVYISPSELLMVYIQISFISAFIFCSPLNTYELWAFLEKGLYEKEKKYVLLSLFFGLFCFVVGVLFCYNVVLPTTLAFFVRIAIDEVASMVSIKAYASFVNVMLVSFGLVFEMPVVVFLLTKLGVLNPDILKKNRGVLIILIFVFAAIITPPDVVSQTMLAIPMVFLLQLSIFISKLARKTSKNKSQEEQLN